MKFSTALSALVLVVSANVCFAEKAKPVETKPAAEQQAKPQRCSIMRDKNCYEQPSRATRALRRLK
jgi:hypothetical protein